MHRLRLTPTGLFWVIYLILLVIMSLAVSAAHGRGPALPVSCSGKWALPAVVR